MPAARVRNRGPGAFMIGENKKKMAWEMKVNRLLTWSLCVYIAFKRRSDTGPCDSVQNGLRNRGQLTSGLIVMCMYYFEKRSHTGQSMVVLSLTQNKRLILAAASVVTNRCEAQRASSAAVGRHPEPTLASDSIRFSVLPHGQSRQGRMVTFVYCITGKRAIATSCSRTPVFLSWIHPQ